jgi:hypothetical protein
MRHPVGQRQCQQRGDVLVVLAALDRGERQVADQKRMWELRVVVGRELERWTA